MVMQTIFDVVDVCIGQSDSNARFRGFENFFEDSPDPANEAAHGGADGESRGDEGETTSEY